MSCVRLYNERSVAKFAILVSLAVLSVSLWSPPVLAATTSVAPVSDPADWEFAVAFWNGIKLYSSDWKELGEAASGLKGVSSIVYDEIGDQIYFTVISSVENGSIYALARDRMDPSKYVPQVGFVEKIHENEKIRSIAFDPFERHLFWIDEKLGIINRLDVKQPKALPVAWRTFQEGTPRAVAVDVCRRYLYWTFVGVNGTHIERAALSGIKEPEILIDEHLNNPVAVEIDQLSNRMFWIDQEKGSEVSVESADLHGGDRRTLYNAPNLDFRSLAVDEKSIYIVEYVNEVAFSLNKFLPSRSRTKEKSFSDAPVGIIKRSRLLETLEDHPVCEMAHQEMVEQAELKEQHDLANKSNALMIIDLSKVICLNGKVSKTGVCQCSDGWTGVHCETRICQNFCFHGKCSVSSGGFPICHCDAGFTGERCETNKCSGYCLNDGRCELEDGEPVCHCSDAFSGRHCEIINSRPVICRAFCEVGLALPNIDWSLEEECSCGNTTAAEPLCSIRSGEGAVTQNAFIYIIVAAVLFTVVLIVVMVLSALRRWYKPLRPKIKKTYVVRKNVTPMTYTPTPTERCEITIENCCNMEYCETPCFDPKILVKDDTAKKGSSKTNAKDDKRDLLGNMMLDNNSDLF